MQNLTSCIHEQAPKATPQETQGSTVTNSQINSCTFCSRQYKSIKTLENHKCPFCKKCNKLFSTFRRFKDHKCKGNVIATEQDVNETINVDIQQENEVYMPNTEVPKGNINSKVPTQTTHSTNSLSELVGHTGTLIPDDVIEEALVIMKTYSPELAPYIGQITPAQFQLLTGASEGAIIPFIPVDKICINIHYSNSHWLTSVFYAKRNVIYVYDSLYSKDRIKAIEKQLRILYGNRADIKYPRVTQQKTDPVCGAFAIAFAFSALLGVPPESQCFIEDKMRSHLKRVIDSKTVIQFPTSLESEQLAAYFSEQTKLQQRKASVNQSDGLSQSSDTISILSKVRKSKKEYMRKVRSHMTEIKGPAKQKQLQKERDRHYEWRKKRTEIQKQMQKMKDKIRKSKSAA